MVGKKLWIQFFLYYLLVFGGGIKAESIPALDPDPDLSPPPKSPLTSTLSNQIISSKVMDHLIESLSIKGCRNVATYLAANSPFPKEAQVKMDKYGETTSEFDCEKALNSWNKEYIPLLLLNEVDQPKFVKNLIERALAYDGPTSSKVLEWYSNVPNSELLAADDATPTVINQQEVLNPNDGHDELKDNSLDYSKDELDKIEDDFKKIEKVVEEGGTNNDIRQEIKKLEDDVEKISNVMIESEEKKVQVEVEEAKPKPVKIITPPSKKSEFVEKSSLLNKHESSQTSNLNFPTTTTTANTTKLIDDDLVIRNVEEQSQDSKTMNAAATLKSDENKTNDSLNNNEESNDVVNPEIIVDNSSKIDKAEDHRIEIESSATNVNTTIINNSQIENLDTIPEVSSLNSEQVKNLKFDPTIFHSDSDHNEVEDEDESSEETLKDAQKEKEIHVTKEEILQETTKTKSSSIDISSSSSGDANQSPEKVIPEKPDAIELPPLFPVIKSTQDQDKTLDDNKNSMKDESNEVVAAAAPPVVRKCNKRIAFKEKQMAKTKATELQKQQFLKYISFTVLFIVVTGLCIYSSTICYKYCKRQQRLRLANARSSYSEYGGLTDHEMMQLRPALRLAKLKSPGGQPSSSGPAVQRSSMDETFIIDENGNYHRPGSPRSLQPLKKDKDKPTTKNNNNNGVDENDIIHGDGSGV